MKKRVVSVLLAVCLCFQMLPAAFADDSITSTASEQSQEQESTTDGEGLPSSSPLEEDESQASKETSDAKATATPMTPMPEVTSASEAESGSAFPVTTATATATPVAPQAALLAEGSAEGATVIGSGDCGENLMWTEYSDRTLIIEGTGPMDSTPWSSFVKTVQIQDGVTSIAEHAFEGCSSLTDVSIPQSIKSIGNSAFAGCERLSNIVIPNGVESIGNSAFYGCKSITSMVLPETLTSIGDGAFNSCSNLSKIIVPASVQEMGGDGATLFSDCKLYSAGPIGSGSDYEFGWTDKIPDNAFHGCGNLTCVSLPSTVTEIGKMAFRYCRNLTNIDLPDHLASIGRNAFDSCESLTSIRIPSGVTAIAPSLFSSCISLEEISIPEGITSIGTYAFSGCASLCSVNIPSTVASIGEWAFYRCPNLKTAGPIAGEYNIEFAWENSVPANAFARCESLESIVIPEGITSIGSYAFRDCVNLIKIVVPESVEYIESDAFVGCDGLSTAGPLGSESNYEFGWVLKFPDHAFSSCPNLSEVILPEGTVEITYSLFDNCDTIVHLVVPDSVTTIADRAFWDCDGLVTAGSIGSECNYEFGWKEKIPANAFSGAEWLESIVIPEGVSSIGAGAFSDCRKLSHLRIPGSVKFMIDNSGHGYDTFANCNNLVTAGAIGSGANYEFGWTTEIPEFAFSRCDSLSEVILPNGIQRIGEKAFYNCSQLSHITIPKTVVECGSAAFYGCKLLETAGPIDGGYDIEFSWDFKIPDKAFSWQENLTKIVLPAGLNEIGSSAFEGCSKLTVVDIPDGVTTLGDEAFCGCSGLTSVAIPDSVSNIGNSAFSGCLSLTNVTIPSAVTSLGSNTFNGCSGLTSITIPASVTSIGDRAFDKCDSLKDVYFTGNENEWNAIAVGTSNSNLLGAAIHYNMDPNGPAGNLPSWHFGTVEAVTQREEHSPLYSIRIDGNIYNIQESIGVAASVMLKEGEYIAYQLNTESNEFVRFCEVEATPEHHKVQAWNPDTHILTTDDNEQYLCDENIMRDDVAEKLNASVGNEYQIQYFDIPGPNYLDPPAKYLVDIAKVETKAGRIQVFNEITGQIWLDEDETPYSVDMTQEKLVQAVNDHVGEEAILLLYDGKVSKLIDPENFASLDYSITTGKPLTWEDGSYDRTEIEISLNAGFIPNTQEPMLDTSALKGLNYYQAKIDKVTFELEDNDLFEAVSAGDLYPQELITFGEAGSYALKLKIRDDKLKETPKEDQMSIECKITVTGTLRNEPFEYKESRYINVTNNDAIQQKLQQVQKVTEESVQETTDEFVEIANSLKWMALPSGFAEYLDLDDIQVMSIKAILLSEIAAANIPDETWQDKVDAEVVKAAFSIFYKASLPSVGNVLREIPVTIIVDTKKYGEVQCEFVCNLNDYSFKGESVGMFGDISVRVKLLEKKGSLTMDYTSGILAIPNFRGFAEGVWTMVAGELSSSGLDSILKIDPFQNVNNVYVKKTIKYIFAKPCGWILKKLYETYTDESFPRNMYKIVTDNSVELSIRCPVDVYVYNTDGTLAGSIENNRVTYCSDEIGMYTDGDEKGLWLWGDYSIVYVATDTGTMDITLTEEMADTDRIIQFEDVPLRPGTLYQSMVPLESHPEPEVYQLTSNTGNVIVPDTVKEPEDEPGGEPETKPEPVITPTDDPTETTQFYTGQTFNVTTLFELESGTGAATYTLLDGGTGTGSLTEDGNLTVTKAGTFVIQVDTAATDTHAAGSAQVTMTVNKGKGKGTLQVTGSTYPAGVQPAVQGNLSGGSVTYYYNTTESNQGGSLWTTDTVLDAGEYWMYAEIAATDLYEAYTTSAVPFTVQQAVVDQLDLANLITAPVRGATPQTELTTSQFAGTIFWSDTPTVFAPETVYTATVKLTAAQNNTLEGLKTDSFQYAGSEVHYDPMANQVTIVFPATDGRQVQSFAVTGTPSKTTYDLGEPFDVTGLTLTVTYDDGTTETVTSGYRVEPATMAADTTQVVISYGGVKAEPVTGLTVRENLVSIQAPQAITGLANGTEKTTEALGLPKTVKITTSRTQRAIAEADVTWHLNACSYDPDVKSEQTFVVQGLVSLPQGMTNLQNVPLTVAVEVTVKAAESKPAEPENPGDTEEKPGASNQPAGGNETPAPTASANAQSAADDTTKEEQNQSVTVPQTGDPTPITVLVVLIAVSLAGILALSTKRKKGR